jgi:hypothetical protein
MFGLFKKSKIQLDRGSSYAVLGGDYIGEIFVYFLDDSLKFYIVCINSSILLSTSLSSAENTLWKCSLAAESISSEF